MGPAPSYLYLCTSLSPEVSCSQLLLQASNFTSYDSQNVLGLSWELPLHPNAPILLLFCWGLGHLAAALADCDLTEDESYAGVSVSWPPWNT